MRGVGVDFHTLPGDNVMDGIMKIRLQVTNPDDSVPGSFIDHKHPPHLRP